MKMRAKRKTAIVVSNKMDKTAVVETDRITRHPLYKKYIKKKVRFKVHDEKNACNIGDSVLLQETRPLSRDKCWRVVEVLDKAV